MKKYLLASGLMLAQILSCPLRAEEVSVPADAAQAKAVFQSLSAEQKDQAKAIAQEKVHTFQQLSPEQRQQKRAEFSSKVRQHRAAR